MYASPARRFAASMIDCLVVLLLDMLAGCILAMFSVFTLTLPMVGLWFFGGLFALSWIYFAGLESSRYQATIGKGVLGLKVTSLSGDRVGFLRASVRYFGKTFSNVVFSFGFIMIFFTQKKQCFHDKIAGTLIVSRKQS